MFNFKHFSHLPYSVLVIYAKSLAVAESSSFFVVVVLMYVCNVVSAFDNILRRHCNELAGSVSGKI